jgi:ATP-binding cassette subfamily C protein CydC
LLRFSEPSRGEILLNGEDLACYSMDAWRNRIGVVSQSPYVFSATIRENLLLGNLRASQEQIVAATQKAQLHELIQSLPEDYGTWIGERGLRLSAGERQRLAIARALLKDPPLLILDEPTANLDTESECRVMSAIRSLLEERSILLVTHRLVCMEWMDEILVMD